MLLKPGDFCKVALQKEAFLPGMTLGGIGEWWQGLRPPQPDPTAFTMAPPPGAPNMLGTHYGPGTRLPPAVPGSRHLVPTPSGSPEVGAQVGRMMDQRATNAAASIRGTNVRIPQNQAPALVPGQFARTVGGAEGAATGTAAGAAGKAGKGIPKYLRQGRKAIKGLPKMLRPAGKLMMRHPLGAALGLLGGGYVLNDIFGD